MPVARQLDAVAEPHGAGAAEREVVGGSDVALRQQHRALDGVPQLADVAGPAVRLQPLHRVGATPRTRFLNSVL